MTDLHAPWALRGESVIAFVRGGRRDGPDGLSAAAAAGPLPAALVPVPGPVVVLAERFDDSPVGPFRSLSFGRPARLGLRPGFCFARMVVTSHDRRVAAQLNWGFPGELGELAWDAVGAGNVVLHWKDRGIVVEVCERGRLAVPALVPMRALQHRGDGPVVVPARFWGRVQRAGVTLSVPPGDVLAPLAGSHGAVWIRGLQLVVRPARHPLGLVSSLQAPLRAPEPGWSCGARTMVGSPR